MYSPQELPATGGEYDIPGHLEPTKYSPLEHVQEYLVAEAQAALAQPTFEGRNTRMAQAVGTESALLAAKSTNSRGPLPALRGTFTEAAATK